MFKQEMNPIHPMRDAAREIFRGSEDNYPFYDSVSILQSIAKASPEQADEMIGILSKWPGTVIRPEEMKRNGGLYVKIEEMLIHIAEKAEDVSVGYEERIRGLEASRAEAITFLESEAAKLQTVIAILKGGEIK